MLEHPFSTAAQSLADAVETMAFVSLMPPEQRSPLPPDLLRVSISFTGPRAGSLELIAPAAFGALLAANMLGCDPTDPDAAGRAADAMKELMNVTCGDLLPKIAAGHPRGFEMGLPQVQTLDDPAAWEAHLDAEPGNLCDAEGHLVAVWLKGAPQ
jgi:hypothetical protein